MAEVVEYLADKMIKFGTTLPLYPLSGMYNTEQNYKLGLVWVHCHLKRQQEILYAQIILLRNSTLPLASKINSHWTDLVELPLKGSLQEAWANSLIKPLFGSTLLLRRKIAGSRQNSRHNKVEHVWV